MSVTDAKKFAKHARSQRTAEAKLDDIAHAIEEIADAMTYLDDAIKRIRHIEKIVVMIANRG